MANTARLKQEYAERIAPALKEKFGYTSAMQIPVLKKIVVNQGLGIATADKKIIEVAINELTAITGQKAVATISKKDVANFKLRKKMPIGVMVTLRRERMYEFLEKCEALLIGLSCSHEGYVHTNDAVDGIDVDLGEDDLLCDAEGVITTAVELALDTLEVTDTGQSHFHEFLKELIHALATEGYHDADGHLLTELEVSHVLL